MTNDHLVPGYEDAWLAYKLAAQGVLRPLAVGRSTPLWAVAGIPRAFVAQTTFLRDAARRAYLRHEGEAAGEHGEYARQLLEEFTDDLGRTYSREDVADLITWMDRHGLRPEEVLRWDKWLQTLRQLAREDVPESDPVRQAAVRVAQEAFRGKWTADLARASEAAASIDVSVDERALLELEVSQPGDDPYVDVIEWMENAAFREAGLRALEELERTFTSDELKRFLILASELTT